MTLEEFEALLSKQMVAPPHLLKVNYQSFAAWRKDRIYFPRGWTMRKR
ncbi:hypothetical protein [Ottowia sp.]|jgi:hypothetical protein|nr:hypothetical protein [Ottowia sp.]